MGLQVFVMRRPESDAQKLGNKIHVQIAYVAISG